MPGIPRFGFLDRTIAMFRLQDSTNLKFIAAIWLVNIWDRMLTLIGNMINVLFTIVLHELSIKYMSVLMLWRTKMLWLQKTPSLGSKILYGQQNIVQALYFHQHCYRLGVFCCVVTWCVLIWRDVGRDCNGVNAKKCCCLHQCFHMVPCFMVAVTAVRKPDIALSTAQWFFQAFVNLSVDWYNSSIKL